jgi:hypothetical protein
MNNIPTGYPDASDDPAGLRVDMDAISNQVQIKFSKPVISLHLNPQQARAMAIALLSNAELALNISVTPLVTDED